MANVLVSQVTAQLATATNGSQSGLYFGPKVCFVLSAQAGGAAGAADDIDVFGQSGFGATGPGQSIPHGLIVTRVTFRTIIGAVGATVQLRSAAAGAGNPISVPLAADAGAESDEAPVDPGVILVSRGGNLYLRRSDRSVTGVLVIEGIPVD